MTATLRQLTERVRSRLTEEVLGYLREVADRAAELPPYCPSSGI